MTQEEIDKLWEEEQTLIAQREAQWNALPQEERERCLREYRDGFYERISDDPFGDDDNQSSST